MTASHLIVLAVAATVGNTVLAVAPHRGRLTDGLSFVSPASSCTTTITTARHARPATAGLSSIAGRPPTSTNSRRPALPGQGFTGGSAWWFGRREGHLRGERADAASAGAGAEAGGSDDIEEQEREKALAELDRR